MKDQPFIIDGVRTAFMRSANRFKALSSLDLSSHTINGLIKKSGISPKSIEYVCLGAVIQDPNFLNVAREAVLESILPKTTPAHTVSMACISSNVASTTIAEKIIAGQISGGIAGGVESFSDLPIRVSKNLRSILIQSKKTKGLKEIIELWSRFRLKDLKLDIPQVKEHSTGFSMGEGGDKLAHRFGITRKEADDFALLSHQRALNAWNVGYYQGQVISIDVSGESIEKDDGPRPTSAQAFSKLPSAFGPFGINTAANSSFFSDGSSAILLGNKSFCLENGLNPLAFIKDYYYAAGDPLHELLLGPALTVPLLLKKHNLSSLDIDVWEIHEAFAGQVLANLRAMESHAFREESLKPLAKIPLEKINLWGGSLSLGHPFGATGARLLLTAAQRLVKENGRLAIVTSCAASGLGCAVLLERGPDVK